MIIFQLAVLGTCILYIFASISFKRFRAKSLRATMFLFVLTGFISYASRIPNWLDFLLVMIPLMVLYQFEDRINRFNEKQEKKFRDEEIRLGIRKESPHE